MALALTMDFSRHGIALVTLIIGIVMICASIWMERRRKHQLMPSLISPVPVLILGGTIALISLVVLILPSRL